MAGWRANSSSTCLPIPTRGASANALLGVAETVSTALYGLRIGLFCFQSAGAECCLAGVAEETDFAFASAFVADTTATALRGSTIARALASRALGVGAVFASPTLCALTNWLLSIGVAETMSLLLEAVVGATLGSAIMALPTSVAATLGNGRLQIASAMTTALLRRTLGHRASTVGAIGTTVTIVALAHTSFLADAMVTAATWADRNAASITHPWASAAARSIAVHNFASAMTTATVGALAGTSSQRTVSTVKSCCTHALFGTVDSLARTLVCRCHAVIWAGCHGAVVANPALRADADDILGVANFGFALATSAAAVFAARLITCSTIVSGAANALASS